MILNTTHYNKEHKQIINDLVGAPFSFMQRVRMSGIGSKRMIVDEVSPKDRNV
jgi:hypothetical protein